MTRKAVASDIPEEQPNFKMCDSDSDYEASPSPTTDVHPFVPNLTSYVDEADPPRLSQEMRPSLTAGDSKLHCDEAPWISELDEGCWVPRSPHHSSNTARCRESSGFFESDDSFRAWSRYSNYDPMSFAQEKRTAWGQGHESSREFSMESDNVWEMETLTREESLSDNEQSMEEEGTLVDSEQPDQLSNASLSDDLANLTLKAFRDHPSLVPLGTLEESQSKVLHAEVTPQPLFYTSRGLSLSGDKRQDPKANSSQEAPEAITFTLSKEGQARLDALQKQPTFELDPRVEKFQTGSIEDSVGSFPDITPEMTALQNGEGDTLLHLGIIHKLQNLVFFVLRMVPEHFILDILNNLRQAPLHLAVLTHQHEEVRSLVVRGARIDIKDRNGDTALHLASRSGCVDCAKALTTPVHHKEVGKCLYKVHFQRIPQNKSLLNYDGQSCLHLAASARKIDMLRYLLSPEMGHDVNIRHGRTGRTILHEAIKYRHLDVIMFLVENRITYGLDVNSKTFDELTPIQLARDRNQADVVFLMLLVGGKLEGIG